ncbi:alpha/beta hydrolase [Streptomyces litchfieldiae]|uniref:Alpha/beta hydrolase n=1 Tax=Streptomyces litchfieldiae TaxID=3075543 RepID=A0ABU2MHK1_9ACTN|nr:alpha/beta hydrolase [Streptomyces sp. DSM 44938]MDT0341077.1 alpha/beta hydrolase [Streptomyces sp. DSM 44938]
MSPVHTDIAYAPAHPPGSRGHLLDLHVPDGPGPWPVVDWSHGSAWLEESGRDGTGAVAAALGGRGFAVAGVAVRSSRHTPFPGQVHDIEAAIRWLRDNAAALHLDAGRLAVMGESSGGWLALMAALTGDAPEPAGPRAVRAAVAFYPPADLLRMDEQAPPGVREALIRWSSGGFSSHRDPSSPESRLLGGPLHSLPERATCASPLTHAGAHHPPVLLLHGRRDPLVPYGQSELLLRAARERGGHVELIGLPRGTHGQWQEFLTHPAVGRGAVLLSSRERADRPILLGWHTVAAFLTRHLAPADRSGASP